MSDRKPWFKTYWSDLEVKDLSLCSLAARGLWLIMYQIFNREPVGLLQVGHRIVTENDLFYEARLGPGDFPKANHDPALEMQFEDIQEVGPSACRALFDSLFQELRDARLFDVTDNGLIECPWMRKRHEINEKRAAGGRRGGNPKLKRKSTTKARGGASRSTTEGTPKESIRSQKSPTDSAQHPQRQRLERILRVFEDHGRQRPTGSSIGALARRLKLYAERHDGDLDAGCDALVADLRDFGQSGKLRSSRYVLSLLDGQLEQERTGQGLYRSRGHRRQPDAGAHPDTLAEAEALD